MEGFLRGANSKDSINQLIVNHSSISTLFSISVPLHEIAPNADSHPPKSDILVHAAVSCYLQDLHNVYCFLISSGHIHYSSIPPDNLNRRSVQS